MNSRRSDDISGPEHASRAHPPPNRAWEQVLQQVRQAWPPRRWCDCIVLIGCSGGADSVSLAVALAQLRREQEVTAKPLGYLKLVHVNHNLRGAESQADEDFVEALAASLGLAFASHRLEKSARDEAALRRAREAAFIHWANAEGARYVAVGHTADDNAETLLHQLFRGSGPAGLAAIASHRPLGPDAVLIRPLLSIGRDAIRTGLKQKGIGWREDASNLDTGYSRNWLRHQLIPLVETRYPGASARVAATADAMRGWREQIERVATRWLQLHRVSTEPVTLLRDQTTEACVIVEALQQLWREQHWPRAAMTSTHWQRLVETLRDDATTRFSLPGGIDVSAADDRVELA